MGSCALAMVRYTREGRNSIANYESQFFIANRTLTRSHFWIKCSQSSSHPDFSQLSTSRMPPKQSQKHFNPFLRGVIYGLFLAGLPYREIAEELIKPDGSETSQQAVAGVVQQAEANGGLLWDGVAANSNAGRPPATTSALDKEIFKLVLRHRGKTLVTPKFVKKKIPAARRVCLRTIRRRLNKAGLAWLRRRRKSIISPEHKEQRLSFARWVLARTSATLSRWAYTDGTVFYLARSAAESFCKKRLALGPFVWRMANGSDGLYEDCIGPSSYAKAQGKPIRIWGLLVAGMLFIYVLPEGETMNRWNYEMLIEGFFETWLTKALGHTDVFLVQDHERCLWCQEPREALRKAGITLLEEYPKCSQDLNVIETAWREVKARLADTEPEEMETRDAFVVRLRLAVAWVNRNRAEYLMHLCNAQKERARDVISLEGGRTKH